MTAIQQFLGYTVGDEGLPAAGIPEKQKIPVSGVKIRYEIPDLGYKVIHECLFPVIVIGVGVGAKVLSLKYGAYIGLVA